MLEDVVLVMVMVFDWQLEKFKSPLTDQAHGRRPQVAGLSIASEKQD